MDYSIILCELNRKISQISCKYGDRYAGFELTLDGHFGNVILEDQKENSDLDFLTYGIGSLKEIL